VQARNFYAVCVIFEHLEVVLRRNQQITDLLIVHFEHGDGHPEGAVTTVSSHAGGQSSCGPRNYAAVLWIIDVAEQGVRLPRGGLSIRHNGAIEPLKNKMYSVLHLLLEDLLN